VVEGPSRELCPFGGYAFTVTATGKHVAMNMHHYWKFRDGKVCYVRSSEDTAQVAAALTP
jgi:ketosteroid isomerase-like protein